MLSLIRPKQVRQFPLLQWLLNARVILTEHFIELLFHPTTILFSTSYVHLCLATTKGLRFVGTEEADAIIISAYATLISILCLLLLTLLIEGGTHFMAQDCAYTDKRAKLIQIVNRTKVASLDLLHLAFFTFRYQRQSQRLLVTRDRLVVQVTADHHHLHQVGGLLSVEGKAVLLQIQETAQVIRLLAPVTQHQNATFIILVAHRTVAQHFILVEVTCHHIYHGRLPHELLLLQTQLRMEASAEDVTPGQCLLHHALALFCSLMGADFLRAEHT